MKKFLFALFVCLGLPAFAQTQAGSSSGSVASTANTNNPTFNYIAPAAQPSTYARVEGSTNQAATAATVFVNPPSADTCAKAGTAVSAQAVGAGAAVSWGGGESTKCDMRADTINLKVTGASSDVIKARHCMDTQMAEAYARAGQPCVDARPVAAIKAGEPAPVATRKQAAPWTAGG